LYPGWKYESNPVRIEKWFRIHYSGSSLPLHNFDRETEMNITEERIGDTLIVGLSGRMETVAALSLEKKVNQLVDSGERKIVFYLAKLEYMTSSGIRAILGLAKRLQSEGGRFALTSLPEPIRELLFMAQLEQILSIYATNGDAIAAFSRKKPVKEL
jgi:anti-anti-sigma factor